MTSNTAISDITEMNDGEFDPLTALLCLRAFAGAPAAIVSGLLGHIQFAQYDSGDTILASGQSDGQTLIGIVTGAAMITRGLASAGDIDIATASAGDLPGLAQVLSGDRAGDPTLTMTAQRKCEVVHIEIDQLCRDIAENAGLARHLLRTIATELTCLGQPLDANVGPERRVFRHLLSLVQYRRSIAVIDPLPRHAALAAIAGVQEQKAASAIAMLLTEGVLTRAYPIAVVNDVDALMQFAK